MLLSGGLPPTLEGWLAEPKLEGWRARAAIADGQISVRTQEGNDLAVSLAHLAPLAASDLAVVLDGELVAGAGRARVMQALAGGGLGPEIARLPVTFVAFDLLWADGTLLVNLPQCERRLRLDELGLTSYGVPLAPSFAYDDLEPLARVCDALGVDGVILKDGFGRYRPGVRSTTWRRTSLAAWRDHLERRTARAAPPDRVPAGYGRLAGWRRQ
jgi:bifunctional non-homologous end joining protein LigD